MSGGIIEHFDGPNGLRGYGRVRTDPQYGKGVVEVQQSSGTKPRTWLRVTCDEDWVDRPWAAEATPDYERMQIALHLDLEQAKALATILDAAIDDMEQEEEQQ